MFKVRWTKSALDELADIWVQSDPDFRSAITSATQTIDQNLRIDPHDCGESREKKDRVHFVFPLGIRFTIDDDKRIARVIEVWSIQRKQK
jgi:hypothetical protein